MEKTSSKIEGRVWAIMIIAWIAMAATQVITFSYGMMLTQVEAEFGLTKAVSGNIGAMSGWASVITTIPIALIANRFNPKYTIPIIYVLVAAGMFLFGYANNVPMLFLGRIISAAVYNGVSTNLVMFKMKHIQQDRIVEVNGIENFVGPIGQTIATLVMAQILVFVGGWRNVYIIIGGTILVCAVAWVIVFREDKFKIQHAIPAGQNEKPKEPYLLTAVKQRPFWLLALGWPGTTLIWIGMFYFWPSYATDPNGLGISLEQAGLVLAMIPVFSAIASLVAPRVAKAVGIEKPFIWMWGLILPVCYFGMTQLDSIPLLMVCSAIAGIGAYFWVPLAFSSIYKMGFHPRVVSLGTAMIMTGVALGSALGGTLVGLLVQNMGLKTGLMVCCLTPLTLFICGIFLPERGRKQLEKEAAAAAAAKATG